MQKRFLSLITTLVIGFSLYAQTGTIRGFVYDDASGEPMIFTNVVLMGTTQGSSTDLNGFFNIPNVEPGTYTVLTTYLGYDTATVQVTVKADQIVSEQLFIKQRQIQLTGVEVTAAKQDKLQETGVSTTTLTPKTINRLPAIGGTPDLAQYLQVLPGVVFTGDQGGQIFIRGGSAIQTLFLIDGMPVYNPFHSIGLFSVFETDLIKNVDVMTGGFGAEYGNRTSAVIDVTTIDGNKKEFTGKVAASPFLAKATIEAPIIKLKENGASGSLVLSGKHSYLDKTSPSLYSYASDSNGLPYSFTDIYGKMTFTMGTGSKISLFGFSFDDQASFENLADFSWNAAGGGGKFVIVPGNSNILFTTRFNYSSYKINLKQATDSQPRFSLINGFNLGMDFVYFIENGDVKYGFDVTGFRTEYEFYNQLNTKIDQNQSTTELAGYFKYRKFTDKVVVEPSLRIQYYGSLGEISLEPRFRFKYNISNDVRLKLATGIYSQNLISTKSDRDVVNLFTGFLSGPEEELTGTDGEATGSKMQRAFHAITGVEYDITDHLSLNLEPYYIRYFQLININRNKLFPSDPNYAVENSNAYGIDLTLTYDYRKWYLYGAYSLAKVDRFDGEQTYPPHFDRRHNINLLASYTFGQRDDWELSARFNLGSGFPFTRTAGFYEDIDLSDGVNTDYTGTNGNLGILYEDELNKGRLPSYHRLDLSVRKIFYIGQKARLDAIASVTNVYDRDNIFYVDRVTSEKIYQLPILPSIGLEFSF